MNRRGFFRFLGQATVVAALAPASVAAITLAPPRPLLSAFVACEVLTAEKLNREFAKVLAAWR